MEVVHRLLYPTLTLTQIYIPRPAHENPVNICICVCHFLLVDKKQQAMNTKNK